MFVSSSEYEKVVTSILAEEGELLAAVAFWGRGAESIFHLRPGQRIKLICNLESGATNPSVIESLLCKKDVVLKQHDRLHAKVVVGGDRALVGSANFSSNGLNFEGAELSGWQEAGLLTSDSDQISDIRNWFDALWAESREITDSDLSEARLKWKQRRNSRPTPSHSSSTRFSLGNFQRSELADRRVFVVIHKGGLTDDGKNAYRKDYEQLTGQKMSKSEKLPHLYQDWSELPKNAQFIDVYYDRKKRFLRCDGAFNRTNEFEFKDSDGVPGHLTVCEQDNHVMGYPFGTKDAKEFAKALLPHIDKILESELAVGDDTGKYISLVDVADICG